MTRDEVLRYLESLESLGIRLALRNITGVLDALGHPERAYPSILISGTNGKGSVAASLAAILTRAGYRTGLYTSPHLVRHEERIVVNGRPIGEEAFVAALSEVREVIEGLIARGALEAHPTHFETITAAAFRHFAAEAIDVAVLEVGMGGRLDATVLAAPKLSLITNVSLEHTAFLGDTIAKIATEKAGILPEGGTLLSGETHPEAVEAFRRRALEAGGRYIELSAWAKVEEPAGSRFAVRTKRRLHPDLETGLRGPHQIGNALLAVAACDLLEEAAGLEIPQEAIRSGLKEAVWPGRFQIVLGEPRLVLDGAHNPAASRALAEALRSLPGGEGGTTLVFGVLRDKQHLAMMKCLFPMARRVILTRGASARFREPHGFLEEARGIAADVVATEGTAEALRRAREATPPSGTICIAGSLYLVGEAMEHLGIEPWPASPEPPAAPSRSRGSAEEIR